MFFNKRAFTLIELLVVVLIISILAAIALPQYEKAVEKSRMAEAKTNLKIIADANKRYFLATGNYAPDLSVLDIDIPGTDYVYDGQVRRQTKHFIYTTIPAAQSPDSLALAQRIPFSQYYFLYIDKNGNFFCQASSSNGNQPCSWFNAEK